MNVDFFYNGLVSLGSLFGLFVMWETFVSRVASLPLLVISLLANLMLLSGTVLSALSGGTPWASLCLTLISIWMTDIIRRLLFLKKS